MEGRESPSFTSGLLSRNPPTGQRSRWCWRLEHVQCCHYWSPDPADSLGWTEKNKTHLMVNLDLLNKKHSRFKWFHKFSLSGIDKVPSDLIFKGNYWMNSKAFTGGSSRYGNLPMSLSSTAGCVFWLSDLEGGGASFPAGGGGRSPKPPGPCGRAFSLFLDCYKTNSKTNRKCTAS